MLNKTNHKTRLTQIQAKHTSNATNKNKKIEESDKIFFFHTLEEPFF